MNESQVTSFPDALLCWSGHRDGGVKTPFRAESGRPAGRQFMTPLIARLHSWIEDLVNEPNGVPRVVLLVGGPGNGKSDAVESCVEKFDEVLNTSGVIYQAFKKKFDVTGDQMLPRKVSVDLGDTCDSIPETLRVPLFIVQEATVKDPTQPQLTAEHLLLHELQEILRPDHSSIYICCVNRGILAHALSIAHESFPGEPIIKLLNCVTQAVAVGPDSPCCWPLHDFEHVAVWPMDVDSLTDRLPNGSQDRPVAHEIFQAALDSDRWHTCDTVGGRCPFCENFRLLSRGNYVANIVKYLRYYELASAKRWTFRELFSLVSHLIVGDDDLVVEGNALRPCEWAAKQIEVSTSKSRRHQVLAGRAPYVLCSRLFHHRLFPRWPRLASGRLRKARKLLQRSDLGEGGRFAREFFGWLDRTGQSKPTHGDDVQSILKGLFGDVLDPALASSDSVLFEKDREKYDVQSVDEAFSLSVSAGMQVVGSRLHPLERDVLRRLSAADDALFEENVPRTRVRDAQVLQATIRQFSSRLAKRSLAVRAGICKDTDLFASFDKAQTDRRELREVRRQLQELLRSGNRSQLSLVTTFGQPNSNRSRRIELSSPEIRVRDFPCAADDSRPTLPMPFLKIDRRAVAVTFQLFKAMSGAASGLHADCLGEELFALLDGVRSMVAGERVRDEDVLEDAEILIGDTGTVIEYRDGQFFAAGADHVS